MEKIFKPLFLATIIVIASLLTSEKSTAQVNYSDNMDENRLVYWFYVSVREVEDGNTGYVNYELRRKGSKVEHGTIKEYNRTLWKYLGNGSKMAIGPFNDFNEAKKAFHLYDVKDPNEPAVLDSSYDENQTVFWFVLHVKRRPRSNSYELIRKPGAVASGNYQDFDIFLRENLMVRVMTIGPFLYMPEAEESKRIYRLH